MRTRRLTRGTSYQGPRAHTAARRCGNFRVDSRPPSQRSRKLRPTRQGQNQGALDAFANTAEVAANAEARDWHRPASSTAPALRLCLLPSGRCCCSRDHVPIGHVFTHLWDRERWLHPGAAGWNSERQRVDRLAGAGYREGAGMVPAATLGVSARSGEKGSGSSPGSGHSGMAGRMAADALPNSGRCGESVQATATSTAAKRSSAGASRVGRRRPTLPSAHLLLPRFCPSAIST